jgi:hypothetical protein
MSIPARSGRAPWVAGLVVRVDRDPVDLGCGPLRWGVPGVAVRGRGFRGCSVGWLIVGLLGLAFLSGLVVFIRKRRARPSADDTLVADLLGPPELPELPAPRTWDDGPRAPAPQAQKDGQPARAPRARKDRWPPRGPGRPSPSPQAREDGQPSRGPGGPSPNPQAREDGQPSPASGQPSRAPGRPPPASHEPSPAAGRPSPAPQAQADGGLPPAAHQPSPAPGRPSPAPQAREDGQPPPGPSAPPAGTEDWLETQLAWINEWSLRMKEQITSTEQPERHSKE